MELKKFRVQMFKSVIDSGEVEVEPLSVLVGKNESGKTTLLRALHKLNPATPDPYDIHREWPRGRRHERDPGHVVCRATFELTGEGAQHLAELTDGAADVEAFATVMVTRDYDGNLEIELPPDVIPDRLHPNQVDEHCEALPEAPAAVTEEFSLVAEECREEAVRLAKEGRFSALAQLAEDHKTKLESVQNTGNDQNHGPQKQHVAQHLAALQQFPAKLSSLPTPRKQAHEYLVERLPRFIYMSDYRAFSGAADLEQVVQRETKKRLTDEDKTFLMILGLSGLDLHELVEQGREDDREDRQYDLDDGARTLTKMFEGRLKQREYSVQFRADGQQFLTMVTDQADAGLIRLEERSKGFQWFFSFDLLFMHESGGTFENCVLLLDEPGLHLHPGAQRDLLERLEEYATGNTLIYSTHLPFMLDLHHPERIRVINETDDGPVVTDDLTETDPDAKLTLQAALGMSGSQSYLVAQRNIVVEGVDDYMLLSELSELLWRSGEDGLPEDALITPAGGASEAAYIATFMIGQRLGVVVLLDSDPAGDTARDKLVKSWLTRYPTRKSEVLGVGELVGSKADQFAIEDLFEEEFYLARVKEVYGKQLAAAGVTDLELPKGALLAKRVERALDEHGISFNKGSVAKRIRRDMSRMTTVEDLPKQTSKYARRLMSTLSEALDNVTE